MKISTLTSGLWEALTRERGANARPRNHRRAKRRRQRGVALLTVLIAISVTLVMTNQFSTTTNVDLIAAANYRDQMRAHFLARSALNLSEIVIRLQQRVDRLKAGIQITDFANQVMQAFCGSPEEVRDALGFDTQRMKGVGAEIGVCGVVGQITTEDDKINLNCANASDASAATLKSALDALVFFNAYDPVFEEPDAENWRRDRALQVSALLDYIDADSMRARERGTTEDYGYESLKDDYRPKNNFIDTVGEIKLVRGVDDRFWTLFGHAFTAYGGCKINLAALSNTQLIAAVLYLTAKNPNDPILQNPQQLFVLAGLVSRARQFGMTFSSADDFADFVKDPGAQVGALAGQSTMAGSQANAAMSSGVPGLSGGQKVGLELDLQKLKQIADAGPRRTYRVEAYGEIERKQVGPDGMPIFPPIRSTITGVWDTRVTPQNVRKPPVPKGTWVFMKED
ncbi:MAG: hypothetical protein ACTHU0_13210 [Kofleriaceae bacterium]